MLWAQFTAEEIEFSSVDTFDKRSEQENVDDQNGSVHTKFSNIYGNNVKLLLKWSILIWLFFKKSHDLTLAGHLSDNNAHEPTLSDLDRSTREQNWGWDIVVREGSLLVVSFVFGLSLKALFKSFFLDLLTFTCHSRLISQDTITLKNDTVYWDVHTGFDLDDVSDDDVVSMDWDFLGVSHDFRDF